KLKSWPPPASRSCASEAACPFPHPRRGGGQTRSDWGGGADALRPVGVAVRLFMFLPPPFAPVFRKSWRSAFSAWDGPPFIDHPSRIILCRAGLRSEEFFAPIC